MGIIGSPAANLFKIGKDGVTFNQISDNDFYAATRGLSRKGKALAKGYMMAINSKEPITIDVVKRSEALNQLSIDNLGSPKAKATIATGAQFDDGGDGAGRTSPNHITVILDSKNPGGISYSDDVIRPASAGETLAHEIIGHWLGQRAMMTSGSVEAVQAGNMYLQINGHNYFRRDHGSGTVFDTFDAKGIPSYLNDGVPGNFDNQDD